MEGQGDEGQVFADPQGGGSGKPDDGEMMRADYTRKTQQLAEEKRQLEQERAEFLAEQAAFKQSATQQQQAHRANPLDAHPGREFYDALESDQRGALEYGASAVAMEIYSRAREEVMRELQPLKDYVANQQISGLKNQYGELVDKHSRATADHMQRARAAGVNMTLEQAFLAVAGKDAIQYAQNKALAQREQQKNAAREGGFLMGPGIHAGQGSPKTLEPQEGESDVDYLARAMRGATYGGV